MLKNNEWNDVYSTPDIQTGFTIFHTYFINILLYEYCFPLTKKEVKCDNGHGWVNPGIRTNIEFENKLYYQSKMHPSESNISTYKVYKNKLTGIIRNTEREHYTNELEINANDQTNTWKVIRKIIGQDSSKANNIKLRENLKSITLSLTYFK